MNKPFNKKLIESIREASRFDSGNLTAPVAILWPDPERQWEPIIGKLQEDMPGVAKADLKNLSQADPVIAPLMEYQYTGAMWIHRNGKEWTVNGFMQNKEDGMGLTLATDTATRDASLSVLPELFTAEHISYPSHVNADFLYQLLFPNDAMDVWVWASMDRSNLAMAIKHLHQLAGYTKENYDATSVETLKEYYTTKGYQVDFEAIQALQACKSEKEQRAVKSAL